ncbi:hypothetical protein SFRURICE_017450 [Spodoptera frugiperda]|nr:hypothetical protein SFRURICE_017450 [Spodoptera frugiperda]
MYVLFYVNNNSLCDPQIMKTFIVIVLLSALAACCNAAVLPNEADMSGGVTIVYDDESPNGRVMSRNDIDSILDNYWVLLSE